jgi:hypothetical protein
MAKVRVATCVPRQYWMRAEKLAWLDNAIAENPCDLFLTSQEFFGGGSTREICRLKGIATDDEPVTEEWLAEQIANLATKYHTHIGLGATVNRDGVNTEDFLYYDSNGRYLGHHSKIALPVQDSIVNSGASNVTPEVDPVKAARVIELPLLGIRVGTVFCWQVFFNRFWQDLADQKCSLVVHPIKFAPRSWYKKGLTPTGQPTRVGFTQNKGSELPEDDALGWIRKLKAESEFKDLPIAVTCNTWDGGEKYLALVGWVDETTKRTDLHHLPSIAAMEKVVVTEYDPELYDKLEHLSMADYKQFIDVYPVLMKGTMRRKATRIERRALSGRSAVKLEQTKAKLKALAETDTQRIPAGIFD